MKRALVVIAKEGFQDVEEAGTRKGLASAGFEVIHASTEKGTCTGKFGGVIEAEVSLKDVNVANVDRVAFIGGPGAVNLWNNEDAKRIARDTVAAGKILGAICIAPKILAAAGVLRGVNATVWNDDGDQGIFLEDHGALYTDQLVIADGRIITASGPDVAEKFGKEFADM